MKKKSNFIISPNIRLLHSKAKQTRIKKAGQRFTYYHRRRKRGHHHLVPPPLVATLSLARARGRSHKGIL